MAIELSSIEGEAVFAKRDLQESNIVYSFLSKHIGLSSFRQIFWLCIIIFVPFAIQIPVVLLEGRLGYGSVITVLPGYGKALGMSWMGDTMVWPFNFLVPLCLLLTKISVNYSWTLLNKVCSKASDDWRNDNSESGFQQSVRKAKAILRMENGRCGRILKSVPWVIAILFWGYNTATCAFYDKLWEGAYPYKSDRVTIVAYDGPDGNSADPAKTYPAVVELSRKVHLAKWDCNRKDAPLSTLSTRVWTVFYYGVPPFLLFQLISTIWGVTFFLVAIRNWERKNRNQSAIVIKAFGQDSFGGLNYLADTGMSYLYVLSGFILLLTMSFLKEGANPSWHNYLLIALFLPVAFLAFITPTVAVREPILKSKHKYLKEIVAEINAVSVDILKRDEQEDSTYVSMYYRLSSLKVLYDHVSNIPEWPFTSSAYLRAGIGIGLPVVMIVVNKLIERVL